MAYSTVIPSSLRFSRRPRLSNICLLLHARVTWHSSVTPLNILFPVEVQRYNFIVKAFFRFGLRECLRVCESLFKLPNCKVSCLHGFSATCPHYHLLLISYFSSSYKILKYYVHSNIYMLNNYLNWKSRVQH